MKFNYGKIVILGFGSLGLSVIWVVYNSFVPLFLQDRFSLAPAAIGFFMTLDNIAALLILPPLGAWSDRVRTPIGRRMPFILAGVSVSAVAFVLVPLAHVLPLFAAGTITLILSMTLWRTPVVALLADITPSPFRSQANGINNFMGGVGGILAAMVGGMLFAQNQAYPFWMGSGVVLTAGILLFVCIREPGEYGSSPVERPRLLSNLAAILRDRERSPLRIFTAHFFWIVALSSIEAFFTLYARNHLGYPGDRGARILGLFPLMLLLTALPAGMLGGKLGRKPVIMGGLVLLLGVLLSIFFLHREILTAQLWTLPAYGEVPVVGGLLMLCGLAWMLINVNSFPMILDLTDNLRAGTYTGISFLFVTAAAIVGPNLMGAIIQVAGNDYSTMYLASAVLVLAAIYIMSGVKKGEAVSPQEKM